MAQCSIINLKSSAVKSRWLIILNDKNNIVRYQQLWYNNIIKHIDFGLKI